MSLFEKTALSDRNLFDFTTYNSMSFCVSYLLWTPFLSSL